MAAARNRSRFFCAIAGTFRLCSLDKQIIYDKLTLQFHKSDERGAVVKSSARSAKGAAAEASILPYKRGNGCWAAGEYVADCHESGALSSVRGGTIGFRTASKHARPRVFHFFRNARFIMLSENAQAGSKNREARFLFPHHSEIVKLTRTQTKVREEIKPT